MKKLYHELFFVPKHGKIKEKIMLIRVALTVAIMVACFAAMSITAYAYYFSNISSVPTVIRSAVFKTEILVQQLDSNAQLVDTLSLTSQGEYRSVQLQANVRYKVTIAPSQSSTTDTGFVVIQAKNCPTICHTQQLGADANVSGGYTSQVSFTLQVGQTTTVSFLDHWGTSSSYPGYQDASRVYITQNDPVQLTIGGVAVSQEETQEEEKTEEEQTQPPALDETPQQTPDDPVDAQPDQPAEQTEQALC